MAKHTAKELQELQALPLEAEARETSLFEDFYETLKNLNKSCDKILEILEEGKGV